MKRFESAGVALATGMLLCAGAAIAQIKEVPGDRVTKTGTVEAIDHQARILTLKQSSGTFVTVDVPKDVTRFDTIKVGDKVTATYYDNVVVRKKAPGEAPVDTLAGAVTPSEGVKPGGTVGAQRTMTATVEAIDPKVPSISFTGPNGWKYSRRVQDKEALKQVKVGDQVDFTWTEAVLLSVDAPGK
jgi:Cu/Ag efflux protein CusF